MKKLNSKYVEKQVVFLLVVSFLLTCIPLVCTGYSPLNEPPTAEIVSISPNPAISCEIVNFTGRGFDPENGTKYFSWDFNGDGTWDVNTYNDSSGWAYDYEIYSYSFPGTYNVTLKVTDVVGNYDTDTAVVEVLDQPPTVDITYPSENQTVYGTVFVRGWASDYDGTVTQVEVKIDDGNWSVANGTYNWVYSWDTNTVEGGSHTIYARSLDNSGNYSEGDMVNVTVKSMSDLKCEGSLIWIGIPQGSTVEGSFQVENIGESGSKLDWEITDYPQTWGTWTFDPSSGNGLKPEDGPVTVKVTVVAPLQSYTLFTGTIKVTNKENNSDFEEISIYLITPKSKFLQSHPFLQFLKKIIDRFPMLARLLNLN